MNRRVLALISTIPTAILVALTYFYFEAAVRNSINFIWNDLFKTNTNRWVIIPLCLVLTLFFFGAIHFLDKKNENKESKGLGDIPKPTIRNYLVVLFIGFLSLLAGASLGPEAILVPASFLIAGYLGKNLGKHDKEITGVLAVAAFVALFTAFFHSILFGYLGLLLFLKTQNKKINLSLVLIATISAITAFFSLKLLGTSPYFSLPSFNWHITRATLITLIFLVAAGYITTYLLKFLHLFSEIVVKSFPNKNWWYKAILVSAILSLLYLFGGNLTEFTGNQAIVPMLNQAQQLGILGLLWILIIKLFAISWSKAANYRGGLVFPTIFIASVLVAITQLIHQDINFGYGLIAVMIGVFASNNKLKFLF